MPFRNSRKGSREQETVLRTMKTVSKAKVISSAERAAKSALAAGAALSAISGMGSPRSSASIPSRIRRKPLPPASTTPAFFRTGFMSMVCSRAMRPSAMAAASTPSRPSPSAAASTARLAASRETVRMVPSVGFITAL